MCVCAVKTWFSGLLSQRSIVPNAHPAPRWHSLRAISVAHQPAWHTTGTPCQRQGTPWHRDPWYRFSFECHKVELASDPWATGADFRENLFGHAWQKHKYYDSDSWHIVSEVCSYCCLCHGITGPTGSPVELTYSVGVWPIWHTANCLFSETLAQSISRKITEPWWFF